MRVRIALSLLGFVVLAAAIAGAQITIDDFTTGPYQSPNFKAGPKHISSQNGSMLGGNRSTNIFLCKPADCPTQNPFNQGASYAYHTPTSTSPGAMIQSAGYGTGPRIDLGYGDGAPMNADLSSADRIRVNFLGLTGTLNFNIQMFTGTSWGQNGCNLPGSTVPFTVELPFTGFVGPGFDKSHVNFINLIFQSSSQIGGINFAIASTEAVNGGQPGAIVCHLN
jgi:hypothetical protein